MQVQNLTLYTPNLERTIEFYNHTLKFPLLIRSLQSATFRIGKTRLTFTRRDDCTPYHIAFNIPSNKETDAKNWLSERVKLIPFNEEEMIDFPTWESKAMYFYDMDNNIIEFIARKNLHYTESMPFIPTQVMGVSEIGMAVDDIGTIYDQLNSMNPLPIFDGDRENFMAAGTEKGLFIILNKNDRQWYPNGDTAYTSDFILNSDTHSFRFLDGEIIPMQ